jgi:hypothetical protein
MPIPRRHVHEAASIGDMIPQRDLYHRQPEPQSPPQRRCERCKCLMASDRHHRDVYCSPCSLRLNGMPPPLAEYLDRR